jgi:hypothetical protein
MTCEVDCVARKWGGSIGIILPSDVVERESIKPNEHLKIIVKKMPLAKDIWNLGPVTTKEPTQKIKDELRKGW